VARTLHLNERVRVDAFEEPMALSYPLRRHRVRVASTENRLMVVGDMHARRLFVLSFLAFAACSRAPSAQTVESSGGDESSCPDVVRRSAKRELAGSTITKCKREKAEGKEQFEVKLESGAQHMEVDVASDGTVLQTEVRVALDEVPPKVLSTFAAKYPSAKPTGAEKQAHPGGPPTYEIAFDAQPKAKEATFAEDGTFVEEE